MKQLAGKTRPQIEAAIKNMTRAEIAALIQQLIELEPHYTPQEIAMLRKMSKRRIVALCQSQTIRAHKPLENGWRIPLSAAREWDESTAVAPA